MEGTEIGTGMELGKQGEQNLKRAQNTAKKSFIPTPILLEWGRASVAPETEHGHLWCTHRYAGLNSDDLCLKQERSQRAMRSLSAYPDVPPHPRWQTETIIS